MMVPARAGRMVQGHIWSVAHEMKAFMRFTFHCQHSVLWVQNLFKYGYAEGLPQQIPLGISQTDLQIVVEDDHGMAQVQFMVANRQRHDGLEASGQGAGTKLD